MLDLTAPFARMHAASVLTVMPGGPRPKSDSLSRDKDFCRVVSASSAIGALENFVAHDGQRVAVRAGYLRILWSRSLKGHPCVGADRSLTWRGLPGAQSGGLNGCRFESSGPTLLLPAIRALRGASAALYSQFGSAQRTIDLAQG